MKHTLLYRLITSTCKAKVIINSSIRLKQSISILSLNVCGLKSKLCIPDFDHLCQNHDIWCLSEVNCDEADMHNVEEAFDEPGFSIIYRVRKTLSTYNSGVVKTAVRNAI